MGLWAALNSGEFSGDNGAQFDTPSDVAVGEVTAPCPKIGHHRRRGFFLESPPSSHYLRRGQEDVPAEAASGASAM